MGQGRGYRYSLLTLGVQVMKRNTSAMYAKNGGAVTTVHFDALNANVAWTAALGMMGRRDGPHESDFIEVHFRDTNGTIFVRTFGEEPEGTAHSHEKSDDAQRELVFGSTDKTSAPSAAPPSRAASAAAAPVAPAPAYPIAKFDNVRRANPHKRCILMRAS